MSNYNTTLNGNTREWQHLNPASLNVGGNITSNNITIGEGALNMSLNGVGNIIAGNTDISSNQIILLNDSEGSQCTGQVETNGTIISEFKGNESHGVAHNSGVIKSGGPATLGSYSRGYAGESDSLISATGSASTVSGFADLNGRITSTNTASQNNSYCTNNSETSSKGLGSTVQGYCANDSVLEAQNNATFINAVCTNSSSVLGVGTASTVLGYYENSNINLTGTGSYINGEFTNCTVNGSSRGSTIIGRHFGSTVSCTGFGSFIGGNSNTDSILNSSKNASWAFGVVGGSDSLISAEEHSTRALGYALTGGQIIGDSRGSESRGYALLNGKIETLQFGSTACGYANNNGIISSNGTGAYAGGTAQNSDALIQCGHAGSIAYGNAFGGKITTTAQGSFAMGDSESNGLISAQDQGAMAFGRAEDEGQIISSGEGSFALGRAATSGLIHAEFTGAFAIGSVNQGAKIRSSNTGSFAGGLAGGSDSLIHADHNGTFAFGHVASGGIIRTDKQGSLAFGLCDNDGEILTQGLGSMALGFSDGANSLIHTGGAANGAIALGSCLNGGQIIAANDSSFALGFTSGPSDLVQSSGLASVCMGRHLINSNNFSTLLGRYAISKNTITSSDTINTINGQGSFQVGGGLNNSVVAASANDGISVILGTTAFGNSPVGGGIADFWNTSGADYAEYFEWDDSNTSNEDRCGYFVQLKNDKIEYAENDEDILGVVVADSLGTSSIIGDSSELSWSKVNLKDELGRTLSELNFSQPLRDLLETSKVFMSEEINNVLENSDNDSIKEDLKNCEIVFKTQDDVQVGDIDKLHEDIDETNPIRVTIQNPDFDPSIPYIPRSHRKEWTPIGLLGKVYVKDDGSCQVNQKCSVENGIATLGSKYHVLSRENDFVVRILIK